MTLNPIAIYTYLINNPKTKWITIILTVIYIISPIDFIPDFIPFFGIIDDGFLIACLVIAFKSIKGGTGTKNSTDKDPNKGPVVDEQ